MDSVWVWLETIAAALSYFNLWACVDSILVSVDSLNAASIELTDHTVPVWSSVVVIPVTIDLGGT